MAAALKPENAKSEDGSTFSRVGAPDGPPLDMTFKEIVLDRIDPDLYIAKPENLWKPPGARAVFGGQVLGQSVAAASRTVESGLALHSLHGYFVQAGKMKDSIVYEIKRVRDGQSFATRSVLAKQEGEGIFMMQASFHRPEVASMQHQAFMPDVPPPESLATEEERALSFVNDPNADPLVKQLLKDKIKQVNPVDVRVILDAINWSSKEAKQYTAKNDLMSLGMPSQMQWFRARNQLPNDEYVHHAVLAYQSDAGLLSTARVAIPVHEFWQSGPMMASLDHAMWFHEPFPSWRADEWLLYVMYSPRMHGARGLAHGHIFTRDGRLVVSCTQEGLVRLGKDRKLQPQPQPKEAAAKL